MVNESIKISKGNKGQSKHSRGIWKETEKCPNCGETMYYSMTISDGSRGRGQITVRDEEGQEIDTTIKSIALYYCPKCFKFIALNDMAKSNINEYLDKNITNIRDQIKKSHFYEPPHKKFVRNSQRKKVESDEDKGETLHNEWMVHFSNLSYIIAKDGFKLGNSYDEKPSQATRGKNKTEGGYNYAYLADDLTYGNSALKRQFLDDHYSFVMFQANGFRFYHDRDHENQVIFDGKSIRNKVLVRFINGYYCVQSTIDLDFKSHESERQHKKDRDYNIANKYTLNKEVDMNPKKYFKNILYRDKDPFKVIEWVKNNYDQYRKSLHYNN